MRFPILPSDSILVLIVTAPWMGGGGDADTVLPTNEQAADFIGCFRHELVHALGVCAAIEPCDWNGNTGTGKVTYVDKGNTLAFWRWSWRHCRIWGMISTAL